MVAGRKIPQCWERRMMLIALVCFFVVTKAAQSPEENSNIRSGRVDLFEGDVVLTRKQVRIMAGSDRASIRSNLWPQGQLVYHIENSLAKEPKAMAVIQSAMREWEQKTCIRFVERKSADSGYVLFFKGSGCWSFVGRTGRVQKLSLAPGCWHKGIVIHEIGHALGFFHEQSRPDRDHYVIIEWDNIIEKSKHNFKKYNREQLDSLGTPYDYGSIMHYGERYFSKNGKPTIVSRKPGVTLGQRRGLSPIDALQMKLLYKCASVSDPSCDFDSNLCGWKQSDAALFSWTHISGRTPSRNTGPSADHSGKGKYVYIEASFPRNAEDFAMLSFEGHHRGTSCMTFYYHMYGSGIGSLKVYNDGELLWTLSGNQGNAWRKAQVTLTGNYHLVIEGVRGLLYTGDIAVDDIAVSPGKPCEVEPTTTSTSTSRPTSTSTSTSRPISTPVGPACGISSVMRVIGGVDAKPGSWPWQVALHRNGAFICGGSLIKPTWVVTAAHCVTNRDPTAYFVRLGDHDRKVKEGDEQDIGVVKIIAHERYNVPQLNNDIALLQLKDSAALNARVGLVCLPKQDFQVPVGANCYITGWGKIKHPGNAHNILQQAKMPPVSQEDCKVKNPFGIEITAEMLCAGKAGSVISGCHGDSGGPYVCRDGDGRWVLQGDVSWGSGICSSEKMFTVFARVAMFRDWIDENVRGVSPPPPTTKSPVIVSPPPPTTESPVIACGISSVMRVIGGVDAKPGSWPWQVALHRNGAFICGGSLIKPTWVVTAAHCVTNRDPTAYFVRLGDHDRKVKEGDEQDIRVVKIIAHERYNVPQLNNDIALLQLKDSAALNARVGLVCLPKQDFQVPVGANCYITGWGKIKHPGNAHNILQQAKMPPVSQEDCKVKNPFGIQITAEMLCAGKAGSVISGCHGDSGGPYVCRDGDGRWVLQGDVSWGSGICSSEKMFTVFARVAMFRDWIDENVRGVSPPLSTTKSPVIVSPPPPTTESPVIAKCGIRPHSRIVGGVQAPKNAWPWQVMLRRRSGSQFCGASLISDTWVVTAAHCVRGRSPQSFYVRLGAHYKDEVSIGTEQDVDISKVISHPNFHHPKQYSNDIALLKLAKPAKLGGGVGLVCLPDLDLPLPLDDPSKKCWITGWGTLQSGGAQPDVLMEATVPLVSRGRCDVAYPGKIGDAMLCAGLDQGGVDACQGDSGGPLVCQFNHLWYLEGVTSWGYGCAKPNKYGVYAKVRKLRSWLETTMANN